MDKKKIIDEDGSVYYVSFRQCYNIPIGNIENIELYKKTTIVETTTEQLGWYDKLKGIIPKIFTNKIEKIKLIHTHNIGIFGKKMPMDDYTIEDIKKIINETIADYKCTNENKLNLDNWDGYIGNDDERKKKVMRNQKIDELLNGDIDKLEEYLNN